MPLLHTVLQYIEGCMEWKCLLASTVYIQLNLLICKGGKAGVPLQC